MKTVFISANRTPISDCKRIPRLYKRVLIERETSIRKLSKKISKGRHKCSVSGLVYSLEDLPTFFLSEHDEKIIRCHLLTETTKFVITVNPGQLDESIIKIVVYKSSSTSTTSTTSTKSTSTPSTTSSTASKQSSPSIASKSSTPSTPTPFTTSTPSTTSSTSSKQSSPSTSTSTSTTTTSHFIKVAKLIEIVLEAHGTVRHETGEGGLMLCVGLLRSYVNANLVPAQAKASAKKKYDLNTIQAALRIAVEAHHTLFGEDIDVILEAINAIHAWGGKFLTTFMVSKNLTNAIHIDFNDGSKSFALFFNLIKNDTHYIFNGTSDGKEVYTWFAFPMVGVFVLLGGLGTQVSIEWDGRNVYHCSTSFILNNESSFKSSLCKTELDHNSSLPAGYHPLVSFFSAVNGPVKRLQTFKNYFSEYGCLSYGQLKYAMNNKLKFIFRVPADISSFSGGTSSYGFLIGKSLVDTQDHEMWIVNGKSIPVRADDIRIVPSSQFEYKTKSNSTNMKSTKKSNKKDKRSSSKKRKRDNQKKFNKTKR